MTDEQAAHNSGAPTEREKLIPRLRRQYPWLDHLIRANDAFNDRHGNHYAAAITYFSVLSLIPILMVGFAILGFIVAGDPAIINEITSGINANAPEGLRATISGVVETALKSGGGIGVFGLLLALYSGIGWMSNLRDALTAQWGQTKQQLPIVSKTVRDLVALVGLAVAMLVSFGLTAIGGDAGQFLLEGVGLADQTWAIFVLRGGTIVLTLVANMLVFLWVLSRLPRQAVSTHSAFKGALVASIGFVILQQVATVYLGSVSKSESFAVFGPVIGLLVFANLVSRFVLFVTAWTATSRENMVTVVAPPPPVVVRPEVHLRRGVGAGAVAGTFGVGAVLGWLGRRRGK